MMGQPFNYDQIFYNEVIYFMEQKWNRGLTDHEKHIAIECYKFGRLVESENEIKFIQDIYNKPIVFMGECSFCDGDKEIVWRDVDGKKACADCAEK